MLRLEPPGWLPGRAILKLPRVSLLWEKPTNPVAEALTSIHRNPRQRPASLLCRVAVDCRSAHRRPELRLFESGFPEECPDRYYNGGKHRVSLRETL
jgi:hypothetical protein